MLRGGTYYLTGGASGNTTGGLLGGMLTFTEADAAGPGYTVTYQSYPDENAVISGGYLLPSGNAWTQTNCPGPSCVWTQEGPGVASGQLYFGEAWANSSGVTHRITYPIIPAVGSAPYTVATQIAPTGTKTAGAGDCTALAYRSDKVISVSWSDACHHGNVGGNIFGFTPGQIPGSAAQPLTNLSDVMIWAQDASVTNSPAFLPISSIDYGSSQVTLGNHLYENLLPVGLPWRIANVYEALAPGQMYLNRKTGVFSYKPFPGEATTNVSITVPVIIRLMVMTNNSNGGNMVNGITLNNLTFSHTNNEDINGGWVGGISALNLLGVAAVSTFGSQNIMFDRDTFEHLGGGAIAIEMGSHHVTVQNSLIHDLGGNGINVQEGIWDLDNNMHRYGGVFNAYYWPSSDWRNTYGDVKIYNNRVFDGGHTNVYSVGINLGMGLNNSAIHNEVYQFPQMGIMATTANIGAAGAGGKTISYNYVHDLGSDTGWISDFGGIYMQGPHPNTVVEYNKVSNVAAPLARISHVGAGANGIYMDDWSAEGTIRYNLVCNTTDSSLFYHSPPTAPYAGETNTVFNNMFLNSGNTIDTSRASHIFVGNDYGNTFSVMNFTHDIVYWTYKPGVDQSPFFSFSPAPPMTADYNMYFQRGQAIPTSQFFRQWNLGNFIPWVSPGWSNSLGKVDVHSQINVDPLLVNPNACDGNLQAGSPALTQLGFTPIDAQIAMAGTLSSDSD